MGKIPFEWIENAKGCWICTSHRKDTDGYAIFKDGTRSEKVHRYIYEECFGQIPRDKSLTHICKNHDCMNIEHLKLKSYKPNIKQRDVHMYDKEIVSKYISKEIAKYMNKIKEHRKALKIPIREIANHLRINIITYSNFENGVESPNFLQRRIIKEYIRRQYST